MRQVIKRFLNCASVISFRISGEDAETWHREFVMLLPTSRISRAISSISAPLLSAGQLTLIWLTPFLQLPVTVERTIWKRLSEQASRDSSNPELRLRPESGSFSGNECTVDPSRG